MSFGAELERTKQDVERAFAKDAGRLEHNNTDLIITQLFNKGVELGPGGELESGVCITPSDGARITANCESKKSTVEKGGGAPVFGISVCGE